MHEPVPVIENDNIFDRPVPDPFIFRWLDGYYGYFTGEDCIRVIYSKDLQTFRYFGAAYQPKSEEHSFWAPALYYFQGYFYLYYSSILKKGGTDHDHVLRVAVADNPGGPFHSAGTLTDFFAIDPHVVSWRGHSYMFYAANITDNAINGRIGTCIWIDKLTSPMTMSGRSRIALQPSRDEEIFCRNRFGDGRDWHTLEGPCFLSDGDVCWLMYSAGAYNGSNYHLDYAVGAAKDDLRDVVFIKHDRDSDWHPLVRGNINILGPGHNSVTQAPDHISSVLVYHGTTRAESMLQGDHRRMFFDSLWRDGDQLLTLAPSSEPMQLNQKPLQAHDFQENTRTENYTYKIDNRTEPVKYIECYLKAMEDGEVSITDANRKVFVQIPVPFWTRIGILISGQSLWLRINEEWQKKRTGDWSFVYLVFHGKGEVSYFDTTLLCEKRGEVPRELL